MCSYKHLFNLQIYTILRMLISNKEKMIVSLLVFID
jgi:hypothetical protein